MSKMATSDQGAVSKGLIVARIAALEQQSVGGLPKSRSRAYVEAVEGVASVVLLIVGSVAESIQRIL